MVRLIIDQVSMSHKQQQHIAAVHAAQQVSKHEPSC
jgi:hypothetical protein